MLLVMCVLAVPAAPLLLLTSTRLIGAPDESRAWRCARAAVCVVLAVPVVVMLAQL